MSKLFQKYLNVFRNAVEDLRRNADGTQETVLSRLVNGVLAHVMPVEVHYRLLHRASPNTHYLQCGN